jgi:hypothetical protein
MCKSLHYRNACISVCIDGMYSVMTQDIALLLIRTCRFRRHDPLCLIPSPSAADKRYSLERAYHRWMCVIYRFPFFDSA